jgi:hypothetical protein
MGKPVIMDPKNAKMRGSLMLLRRDIMLGWAGDADRKKMALALLDEIYEDVACCPMPAHERDLWRIG